MSGFWGMNTEEVLSHANRIHTATGRIEDLRSQLDSAVNGVDWAGPDADGFRARWSDLATVRIASTLDQLRSGADSLQGEADQQDVISDSDGTASGPAQNPNTIPPAHDGTTSSGYRHDDNPWIPNWLEDPAEWLASSVAQGASELIGLGGELLMDGVSAVGNGLGLDMSGFEVFRRDVEHLGGTLTDLATGQRVPTIMELVAGGATTFASGGAALYDMIPFVEGTDFFDDRRGGVVHNVATDSSPQRSPQTLQDLVVENNALTMDNPDGRPLTSGQIGIQEVRSSTGGEPSYIVQIPPTEGADIGKVPEAWGGQGHSRDWASNVRMVAGQDVAAMDDVRAAMEKADIPPGSNVMFVGHSQGGIIANHLAADPTFNNSSGADGSYNVTHAFSVGSPVQTVVPAQSTTQSVNVSHEVSGSPGNLSGDYIAELDAGGMQLDGGTLSSSNRHEVSLPGYPTQTWNPIDVLHSNHNAVGPGGETSLGYAGTVGRHTHNDPTLSALQQDLTGVYIGDGTYVSESKVVEAGRD